MIWESSEWKRHFLMSTWLSKARPLLFSTLVALLFAQLAVAEPTPNAILTAWKDRTEHTNTIKVEWTEMQFQAAGSIDLPPTPEFAQVRFPEEDITCRRQCSCALDGSRMRFSFKGESLQLYNEGKLEYREYFSASDGVTSKAFMPLPNKLRNYPWGVITEEVACVDAATLEAKPILLVYRATNELLGWPKKPWLVANQNGDIQYTTDDTRHSVWVDAEHDYLPTRYSIVDLRSNEIKTDLTIEYVKDGSTGTVSPSKWTIRRFEDGSVKHLVEAKVTKCVINEAIPLGEFQIEFPVGTHVVDMQKPSEAYEVGENGAKILLRNGSR